MIIDGNIVVFKYKDLHIVQYVEHLNAYSVAIGNNLDFITQDNLADFHPLGIHKGFEANANKYFVVQRYRIDCMQWLN